MAGWYGKDLAYIHDAGFGDYALGSASGILEILRRTGLSEKLVVDLGCGSGMWARELIGAGYPVFGIDISREMIQIARQRAPEAEFRVGSLFDADIPRCGAVTSVGEVLNYLFDPGNDARGLVRLFRRVYDALMPGGVFVFDVAGPGQVPHGETVRGFTEGEGWIVLVEKKEERKVLTRRISTFRKIGELYRRDDEVHRQRLYDPPELEERLRHIGFLVQTMNSYGGYRLPKSHTAFVASKPA